MSPSQPALTLLLPGLAPPMETPDLHPRREERQPEALRLLLSRATVEPFPAAGLEAQLFRLFGHSLREGELPVAELTYPFDGGERSGYRLRCDPVHLVPGHNSLVLSAGAELRLSPQESAHLVAELNRAYADMGWSFEALTPTRWYLTLPEPPGLRSSPLPQVVGRSVERFLPRGEKEKAWHTRLAEIQMLLHGSAVNRQREAQGEPVINSLWLWGEGALPQPGEVRWAGVWSDEPVARALARRSGIPFSPTPATAREWLEAVSSGEHLLVLDRERYLHRFQEQAAWLAWLQGLEESWFRPLMEALRNGELQRLTLMGEGGRTFRLDRRALRRWWRRRRPIERLLEGA